MVGLLTADLEEDSEVVNLNENPVNIGIEEPLHASEYRDIAVLGCHFAVFRITSLPRLIGEL